MTLPGYQIRRTVYTGPNTLIYRARRETDGRPVMIKILKPDQPSPEALARFRQEYEMTAGLKGAGVIKVYGLEPYGRTLAMILEDFGGTSLDKLLPGQPASVLDLLRLALRITANLGVIHQQHVIHKNIKPANIVWNRRGGQVKIIDFGLATTLPREIPAIDQLNGLEGTLAYISPEQTGRMNRSLDYRSDFYSLGVTFYELFTGQLPFESNDPLALVHAHLAKMPPPPAEINPQLPTSLSQIIMKLLAKTAEERYQTAFGLQTDLQQCLDQLEHPDRVKSFELGQADLSGRFQLPHHLYGRDTEINTLLAAFARVSEGHTEMMLVSGYAGIGKSALIQELHKPFTRQRGYFIAGKFDQLQRNTPYQALLQAFQGLTHQLLSQSQAELDRWRAKLLAALGPNGQIMLEAIPDLILIIGPQPPVPQLPLVESQNRFNFVMQSFIQVFATAEHPLVMFVDDLHWADIASLKLLELFMTEPDLSHVLIIGAYRNNEVDAIHPLSLTVTTIQQAGAIVNHIRLAPLDLAHINQFIADTLHVPPVETHPLAELTRLKTDGNPFFMIEFLKALYAETMLVFVPGRFKKDNVGVLTGLPPQPGTGATQFASTPAGSGYWRWNLAEIQAQDISDNVVDLMAGKVQQLSPPTQAVLKIAACLGDQFKLETLALVYQKTSQQTVGALGEAIAQGLVLALRASPRQPAPDGMEAGGEPVTYKFAHDRIQQAVYSLIAEAEQHALHWQIGQLLLQHIPLEAREAHLFDIVDQLNLGRAQIAEAAQARTLAELNLSAGKKAAMATAYVPALNYLRIGLELLPKEHWQTDYDLMFALTVHAAQAAYLSRRFAEMEQRVELGLQHAKTLLDEVRLYEIKIQALIAEQRLEEALAIVIAILKRLGVNIPQRPNKVHPVLGFIETRLALRGKSVEDLAALPAMTDPYMLAVVRILELAAPATFVGVSELAAPILSFKSVSLQAKYGNTPSATFIYSAYGLILCDVLEDFDRGYQFGQLALKLSRQPQAEKVKAKALIGIHTFIFIWKKPLKDMLDPLLAAHHHALQVGDLAYAAYAVVFYCSLAIWSGKGLAEVEQEIALYNQIIEQLKQEIPGPFQRLRWQFVLNLRYPSADPCRLVGEVFNEETMLPVYFSDANYRGIFELYFTNLVLCYLFQAYDRADKNARLAEKYLAKTAITGVNRVVMFFYAALTHLALYDEADRRDRRRILKKVAAIQTRMKKWAKHAPMNHLHKYYLIEAERARVLAQDGTARDYYDQAMTLAQENEYVQEEALAHELAGKFYLTKKQTHLAGFHLRQAHYAYTRWGATIKAQHLEAKYPDMLISLPENGPLPTKTTISGATSHNKVLDLASVIKASQAISGEIVFDKLLTMLMKIIIENAGAQRGHLLLPDQDRTYPEKARWLIEAAGGIDEAGIAVLQSLPLETTQPNKPRLPLTIINYVSRTQENVVLSDAAQAGAFTHDAYIQAHQPRSVLCMPLLNQAQLVGLLYLENNLSRGAFTPDHVQLLSLLSTQAAVSIENARLYTSLQASEQKYRTLFEDSKNTVYITTPAGQIIDINPAGPELFGYTKAEMTQMNARDFFVNSDEFFQLQTKLDRKEAVRDFEVKLRKKDGQEIDCLISTTLWYADDGTVLGYRGIVHDITARKQREQMARKLEAHRNSPLGQAEQLAEELITEPEQALIKLYHLAQITGQDSEATRLMYNLPQVLRNIDATAMASVADGFSYILSSQVAPEMLSLGLRVLIEHLARPPVQAWLGAAEALHVYRLCQAALAVETVADIDQLGPGFQTETALKVAAVGQPEGGFLVDLGEVLQDLQAVAQALTAYQRVERAEDKMICLTQALESLVKCDYQFTPKLMRLDRLIVEAIIRQWNLLIAGAVKAERNQAELKLKLITQVVIEAQEVTLEVEVANAGYSPAHQAILEILPDENYKIITGRKLIPTLQPGQVTRLQFMVQPLVKQTFSPCFSLCYEDKSGIDKIYEFRDSIKLLSTERPFTEIPNPYVPGGTLGPDSQVFIGREELLAFIERAIGHSGMNALVLTGRRRMGKTSLVNQLPPRLNETCVPVYLDCQGLGFDPGMSHFLYDIALEIADTLDLSAPSWEAFAVRPHDVFERDFLPQVLAAAGRRRLLLLLDEYEELEARVDRGKLPVELFAYLRHLMLHLDSLSLIFVGTHQLSELNPDYWSTLLNVPLHRRVSFLTPAEARKLIVDPVNPHLVYEDLAVNRIIRLTGGYPYFLQLLCYTLVAEANRTRQTYITLANVNQILDQVLEGGQGVLTDLWERTGLAESEKLVLSAVAHLSVVEQVISSAGLIRQMKAAGQPISKERLADILTKLEEREILRPVKGVEDSYEFVLELLKLWLIGNT